MNLPFGDARTSPLGDSRDSAHLPQSGKEALNPGGPRAAGRVHGPRSKASSTRSPPGLQSGLPGRQPRRSPGRAPGLLVAQESLLAPQHLPQLRQTPQPQVLGSRGLEAAEQRGHHEARAAVGSEAALARRQAPLLAPDPRPPMPLGHYWGPPFSRKRRAPSS